MKELSVLSLICSCFYPEMQNKLEHEFEGTDELRCWFCRSERRRIHPALIVKND